MQKYFFKKTYLIISLFSVFLLMGCNASSVPDLNSVTMTPERLARQEIQSHFFEVEQPQALMRAAMNVIQDQHYTIREANAEAGIVFADQTNELNAPFRLFGMPVTGYNQGNMSGLGFSFGPSLDFGGGADLPYVQRHVGSISVVIYPAFEKKGYEMHVSVEIRSFLNTGMLNRVWLVKDPKLYQSFFEAISKSLYLEVHPS